MKKIKFSKTYWRNIFSLFIFGAFIHFAMSTIPGTSQQKFVHPDGRVEIAKTFTDGTKEIITGKSDGYEAWQGPTTIEYQDEDGNQTAFEEVNMTNGVRNGTSVITYPGGKGQKIVCYEMGERVDCEKSAAIGDNTAYEILDYRFPWFTLKFNVFGFSDQYIQAFMDTFEIVINSIEDNVDGFDEAYEDASDILEETRFADIFIINSELTLYYGMELIKFAEFRRAVIDQHRMENNSIYDVVKNSYPNYLTSLNEYSVSDNDFKTFAAKFDEVMTSYGPLDENDPYFIDSLDTRMFRAIMFIYDEEEENLVAGQALKSLGLAYNTVDMEMLREKSKLALLQVREDLPPQQVASVVMSLIFLKFADGDLVRRSVNEWYSLKTGVVSLPVTTTRYQGRNSSSSVTMAGNITFDGGAEISERGIVWGTGFNPMLTDNKIVEGNGAGSFETQINGLNESETYYARSFATNSAGTAYGNCIQFTTSMTVGNQTLELSDNSFIIYPNPASDKITISFKTDSPRNATLLLINVNGQVVKQKHLTHLVQGENQIILNISNLDNGIYSCRVTGNGNVLVSRKLVITH